MAKKPASKKKPAGKPLAARLKASPALVKKYQSDPGLRSKYLTGSLEKYLTSGQRKTRALNTRLNAPIAPGSSTTERDLAHEAQAAQTVRYGPQDRAVAQQLGVAQQTERDTGSFYDQYRQALQEHSAAVQAFQAGAQQALGATAAGITGLGQQQAAQLQQQADAGAAQQGVAQAGQIGDLANQALAVRQGVMGTFQGEQALRGAAANVYSNAQANVVAPAQKLSALVQARGRTRDVRQKQADLATEEGAFNQQFRQERRGEEFKNQLAMQTLNIGAADKAADNAVAGAKAAADIAAKSPAGVAASATARTTATAEANNAARLGISVHQYRMLGPTVRAQRLKSLDKTKKGTAADTRYTSGPFAGMLKSDVNALSNKDAQAKVDAYNSGKGPGAKGSETTDKKAFRSKYGVDLQTTTAHNSARDSAQNSRIAFGQVGKVVKQADGRPHRVTTNDVVNTLRDKGTSNLWIRVGIELARGGITPGTAARIHRAGYSVATLGLKMRSGAASRPSNTTTRPGSGPAGARR